MNAVEMRGIVKQYPLVRAVDGVDFSLAKGEVHSLLGENGAGKSTLMGILYGMTQADEGDIYINGEKIDIQKPSQAIALRIGMVHQHFMLAPVMTVTENIIVGSEPGGQFLNYKKASKEVGEMIDRYNFQLDPNAKVQSLSVGQQQRVEILKALYRGADTLILDEPTAVLTPQEVQELFTVIRELKSMGKSIVIITHKLKETIEIADRVSVLRNGQMITAGRPIDECTIQELALIMVGRDVDLTFVRRSQCESSPAFEIRDLNLTERGMPILKDVDLTVCKGQIVGIAGVEGNGQTELIEVLTGLRKPDRMTLLKDGQPLEGKARDFLKSGVGHIPEDRTTRGLVLPMTIEENIILGYHKGSEFSQRGILNRKSIRKFALRVAEEFNVRTPQVTNRCNSLSGGNQQKVVIARVFSQNPDILIAAQPTRGVDVGAQEYIHNRLLDLRDQGKAILLISADLDEVRRLSDRIAVMYGGRIVAQAAHDVWDEMELGLLMAGASLEGEGDSEN